MSRISTRTKRDLVTFASDISIEAGKILRNGFAHEGKVRYKGRIDPVTEFDLKSERYLIDRIRKQHPGHGLLAEEGGRAESESEFRWILDPLDGTVNYAHRFPIYCVSVGLEYQGQPLVGAVYDPEQDELYHAARGLGARLNGKKIKVSTVSRVDRALLATGFSYNIGTAKRNNLGLFARMAKKAQAIRRLGSAALDLCWLAAGRIDGFWELNLHPWDTAAATVIVEEAGGKVSRMNGKEYSVFDEDILASNGRAHRKLSEILTGTR